MSTLVTLRGVWAEPHVIDERKVMRPVAGGRVDIFLGHDAVMWREVAGQDAGPVPVAGSARRQSVRPWAMPWVAKHAYVRDVFADDRS